jgi:SET domain-containing protein
MPPLLLSAIAARQSDIHGHGVYAQQSISAGDFITEYTGERITLEEAAQREKKRQSLATSEGTAASDYLYILDDETAIDGRHVSNIARLINHACEPNCRSDVIGDRIWIIATCAIAVGEEITFDYCYTFKDGLHHPCRCGSPHCVGFIIDKSQRWRLKRWREKQK